MTTAYVGLGANIGEPRRQLQAAISELGAMPGIRVTRISGFYRSAPLGYLEQPEFLNAVVELDTDIAPGTLLEHLQKMENRHGRERPFPGAPRTLDLDLLLHGNQSASMAGLTLPHPRMHERAFVLEPLTEIAPDIIIPGRGAARDLLAACRGQIVQRIDANRSG